MQSAGARTVAVLVALTLLVSLVALAGGEPIRGTPSREPSPARPAPETFVLITDDFPVPGALPPEVFGGEAEEPGPPAWLRWAVAVLGAAGILAAGAMLVREMRRRGPLWRRGAHRRRVLEPSEPADVGAPDDLRAAQRAFDSAIEPLRAATDARAAVIEAYARMEQVLADEQLGRRTPEAPREYLGRVLRERDMPELPLATLTALFEEARFSVHPIPDSAPGQALSELEQACAALEAATPRESAARAEAGRAAAAARRA